jgi:hypothetical protein
MNSSFFWDITPCSTLKVSGRFGRICHLHLQGRTISQPRNQHEIMWQTERTTRRYIPEDRTRLDEFVSNPLPNRCSNTKSVQCIPRLGRILTETSSHSLSIFEISPDQEVQLCKITRNVFLNFLYSVGIYFSRLVYVSFRTAD